MSTRNSSKALNTALWAAQAFLAIVFFTTGAGKLFLPLENLYALIPWTKDVNSIPVRLIGLSEIIVSIGLILPALLRIKTTTNTMGSYRCCIHYAACNCF